MGGCKDVLSLLWEMIWGAKCVLVTDRHYWDHGNEPRVAEVEDEEEEEDGEDDDQPPLSKDRHLWSWKEDLRTDCDVSSGSESD